MKKVLVLLTTLDGGGAVTSTALMVQGLQDRGYDVTCAVLSLSDGVLPSHLQFLTFDLLNLDSNYRSKQLRRILSFFKLKKLFKEGRFDVVFCSDSPILAWVACQALKCCGLRKKTFCCHIQRNTFHYALNNHFKGALRKLVWNLFKRIYRAPDMLIAISRGVEKDLLDYALQAPQKIRVIYNPVIGDFEPLQQEKVDHPFFEDPTLKIILGAGYLIKRKGFDVLIKAFGKIASKRPEVRLIVLGGKAVAEGEDQECALRTLIKQLELKNRVSLEGYKKNPFPYMSKADVFVLSSFEEGFGRVLVEAMSCGTTPVSTDCLYGPSEILEEGKYGYLVPVGDVDQMASGIEQALNVPFSPDRLKKRADCFSITASLENYVRLIEERAGRTL